MQERLQKIIAKAGVASRREAEEMITSGRVKVNGKVVTALGTKASLARDKITVDGKRLESEKKVYILLNKPKGVVTTLKDPENRKTVSELVPEIQERIFPVGRLDYNTEGLLLMTNDGDLAQLLTHPSHEIKKTYLVKVKGVPTEEKLDVLRKGVKLEDGVTAPSVVHLLEVDREKEVATLEIAIWQGKNRQVRRMFEAIGYLVRNLKRVQFAFLDLGGVKRGQYRKLLPSEIERLKKLAKPK